MQHLLWATALAACCGALASAQDLAGDWVGTLDTGAGGLRLVVHVGKSAGGLKATMDSPDQNAKGIPISSIALEGAMVKFASDAVHGTYEGKLSADGNTIVGAWTQGQPLPLTLRRAAASDLAGAWSGTLDAGGQKLRLVFHIAGTTGGLTASLDSLDQSAKGIPISKVTRNGSSLAMECAAVGGKFEGTISQDLSTIDGTWSQGGGTMPLVLKHGPEITLPPPKRPQNPVKPYPYQEEEVKYPNPSAGITLAGTFTVPRGKGPFPAVLLIAGSGPHDRNEELMGHRPFLVLSDYLTRRGIAVLRADKRGVGESGGKYDTATSADFASDAEAGVAWLKTRPEVNARKIGLAGHSEGGLIAPMVAARNPDVAFLVLMAGPGVPGDQTLPEQLRLLSEAAGMPHEQAVKQAAEEAGVIAMVEKEQDTAALRKQVEERFGAEWPKSMLDNQVTALSTPWMRYFLAYDPAAALRKVTCPVLALNGSKDLQVPPKLNLPAIKKALEDGGNKHFEIVELPGLNHLFQTAGTGGVAEYERIEETIAPAALQKIASWILQQR